METKLRYKRKILFVFLTKLALKLVVACKVIYMSVNFFRLSSKIFDIFSILMNGDQFGRHGNQTI